MRTNLFVAALILGLLQAVSPANAHGDDSGHKHQTVTEQQAIEFARAAARVAGADRWSESRWRDLEAQVAPSIDPSDARSAEDMTAISAAGRLRGSPRRPRRVFQSSYVN
jgi:hypothetical protein